MAEQKTKQEEKKNPMTKPFIEKVVLSIGSTGKELEKGVKLLERITEKKVIKRKSHKRIPSLDVSPGLEVGCMVTLRGKKAIELLKRLFESIDDEIRKKKISKNSLSFGIEEYIEIPGVEYQRDLGILGFNVNVTFTKPGKRIKERKRKKSKIPVRQQVSEEEIINYLENKLGIEVIR